MFASKWLYNNFHNLNDQFKLYVFVYLILSGVISAIFVYVKGPMKNPKYISIIEWILKFASIMFIFMSFTNMHAFISFLGGCLTYKMLYWILSVIYKPKSKQVVQRKWMSKQQYAVEAEIFTCKQLEKLKIYCKQKYVCCKCDELTIALNFPDRFEFIYLYYHLL